MDPRRLGYLPGGGRPRHDAWAAAASFVSRPALSKAIRELETELGTPLFHRVGRRVVMTAAGEALIDHARRALRDVQAGAQTPSPQWSSLEARPPRPGVPADAVRCNRPRV